MNIVFDFGGVLFRWQPDEFMPRLLPRVATDAASTHALVLAFFQRFEGDWGDFDRGRLGVDELSRRIARRVGLSVEDARRVIDAVPDELVPLPESVELLRRLRAAGHTLHYLSNMPLPYAEILESRNDFLGWFEGGVFSSRVDLIKPEATIFELAAERFGTEGSETVFIDDVEKNIVAARTVVGWRGVRFLSAADCRSKLMAMGVQGLD